MVTTQPGFDSQSVRFININISNTYINHYSKQYKDNSPIIYNSMSNSYENVSSDFENKGCKLLVTKEEFDVIKQAKQYKLNYIASCGHNHIVFYNVFKSRNTGIVCPNCKNKANGTKIKEKMMNNEIPKIHNLEQEFKFIKYFQSLIENNFDIIKAFDGCNVDMIYKPKNINENNWVGIQVKTTGKIHLTYSFHNNNLYENCLILLYCCEDNNMWLIPENIIKNQKKISIGCKKSKYDIYNVKNETILIDRLHEFYDKTNKFEFDILNTPTNVYQQREQEFRNFRQEMIKFIDFKYNEMEGTVYDFKIGNYKIQDKVTVISENNTCNFQLCKNNGNKNRKRNQIQYDIGDNDFYWLNCGDKKYFFVIPEKILVEQRFIGNTIENKNRKILNITIIEPLNFRSDWLTPYMFNYNTINEEENKNRLLDLFK